jgi:molecular chaperone DnaJ
VTRVNISFSDAAIGTTIALRWIDDSVLELEIPAGTQPGEVITMKGKGAPRVDGRGRGALHVQVQVDVPRQVSARAKALLVELEGELNPKSKRVNSA